MLKACEFVVKIPTRFSINVGMAGAIVLYDRLMNLGGYGGRPVTPGGEGADLPPVHNWGAPLANPRLGREGRGWRREHFSCQRPDAYKPAHATPALKISNLRKVYRRGTVAVDDLSLTVRKAISSASWAPMARASPPPSIASPASPSRAPAPSRFSGWMR